MSATVLPSLPLAPSTAAPPAAPAQSHASQQQGPSFNAHLQSAQQQPPAQQDAPQTTAQNGNTTQGDTGAGSTPAQPGATAQGTAKPGDAAATNASQDDATDSSDTLTSLADLAGGAGTLAGAVLSLIDHATGHAHGATAANAAPAKSAGNRQATVTAPTAPVAAMIAVQTLPANVTPTAMNAEVAAVGSPLGLPAMPMSPKPSTLASDLDAGAGDTGADNTTAPASADAATPAQGSADNAQALAGNLVAASNALLPTAAPAASDNSPQAVPDLAALGHLASSAPVVAATDAGAAHNLSMNAPVGSSGFARELGQQITWLSGQDVKQAQIRLHPQDLGPLDVKVSVEHGRVDVSFLTQHPAATAAVQQGLDQLNQMLGGQGLSLGHATVGQHAQQQASAQQGQAGSSLAGGGEELSDAPVAAPARVVVGLVDAFA